MGDATKPGIVILGAPRSGTTLLRRLLDAHPNIACPPETYALAGAARFLHEDTFAQGLQIGALLGLGYAGFEEAEVLGRLRAFVFSFLEDHAKAQGKPRWAEKTAFNAFHLPAIRRLCDGHVRYVCIRRHGVDVAISLGSLVKKTGGFVDELHAYVRRYPDTLEAYARAWIDTATAIEELAEQQGDAAHSMRYEDLVERPEEVLRGLFEFLEEPWDEEAYGLALTKTGTVGFGDWKTYTRLTIDKASLDRWKGLPAPMKSRMAAICNPTLQKLGYDPIPEGSEDADPDEARRRYELGLLLNRMRAEKQSK